MARPVIPFIRLWAIMLQPHAPALACFPQQLVPVCQSARVCCPVILPSDASASRTGEFGTLLMVPFPTKICKDSRVIHLPLDAPANVIISIQRVRVTKCLSSSVWHWAKRSTLPCWMAGVESKHGCSLFAFRTGSLYMVDNMQCCRGPFLCGGGWGSCPG